MFETKIKKGDTVIVTKTNGYMQENFAYKGRFTHGDVAMVTDVDSFDHTVRLGYETGGCWIKTSWVELYKGGTLEDELTAAWKANLTFGDLSEELQGEMLLRRNEGAIIQHLNRYGHWVEHRAALLAGETYRVKPQRLIELEEERFRLEGLLEEVEKAALKYA